MEEKVLRPDEDALIEREEKCRKALKTVTKAIVMRVLITAILIWVVISSGMPLWCVGMLALVLLINLSGLMPLCQEWKKQRSILRDILDQYE